MKKVRNTNGTERKPSFPKKSNSGSEVREGIILTRSRNDKYFLLELSQEDRGKNIQELLNDLDEKEMYVGVDAFLGIGEKMGRQEDTFSTYNESAKNYEEFESDRKSIVNIVEHSPDEYFYVDAGKYGFMERTEWVENNIELGNRDKYADEVNVGDVLDHLSGYRKGLKIGYNARKDERGKVVGENFEKDNEFDLVYLTLESKDTGAF